MMWIHLVAKHVINARAQNCGARLLILHVRVWEMEKVEPLAMPSYAWEN